MIHMAKVKIEVVVFDATCWVLRKTKSVVRKGVARGFYQLVKGHRTKENRTTDRQSISLPDQTAYGTALSQHHTDADYSILNTNC